MKSEKQVPPLRCGMTNKGKNKYRDSGWAKMTTLLGLAVLLVSTAPAFGQQNYPIPTAPMQAIIDKDNGRHFGDSPADPGPVAKDLSPALKAADIDKAMRKVADWELVRNGPYFDQIWTSSVDYTGFMALYRSTGDTKYRDA